ncbi:SpoIIE family protein phosphatase [Streptomyces sp. ISL-1]|uniref:SpoIIE family protein phosphatase n=1 Tax=Streptomyces sp. ISL-1 TaxID=2817657 RepID=UPI0027E436D5|nr:SpoIIE family protein phosphatase [Streptomyces sp. ISL-1]
MRDCRPARHCSCTRTERRTPTTRRGKFFGLEAVLAEAALGSTVSPAAVITTVHSQLLRHTGGRLADDVALLVLRNDRSRVPAQCGDTVLRRTRPEPSNR